VIYHKKSHNRGFNFSLELDGTEIAIT